MSAHAQASSQQSQLTRAQIETFAQNAGFAGQDLETAIAIAFAESSGNPDEYNPESAFFTEHDVPARISWDRGSYGLWQIFRFEHPECATWNLRDPQVNACAAFLTYSRAGKKFAPWSTFTGGAYKKFLPSSGAEESAT